MKIVSDPAGVASWKQEVKCSECHCTLEFNKSDIKRFMKEPMDELDCDYDYYIICQGCTNQILLYELPSWVENYVDYNVGFNRISQ